MSVEHVRILGDVSAILDVHLASCLGPRAEEVTGVEAFRRNGHGAVKTFHQHLPEITHVVHPVAIATAYADDGHGRVSVWAGACLRHGANATGCVWELSANALLMTRKKLI